MKKNELLIKRRIRKKTTKTKVTKGGGGEGKKLMKVTMPNCHLNPCRLSAIDLSLFQPFSISLPSPSVTIRKLLGDKVEYQNVKV